MGLFRKISVDVITCYKISRIFCLRSLRGSFETYIINQTKRLFKKIFSLNVSKT